MLTLGVFVLLEALIAAPAGDAADRAPDGAPRTTPAFPAMASPKCKTGAWRTATHC